MRSFQARALLLAIAALPPRAGAAARRGALRRLAAGPHPRGAPEGAMRGGPAPPAPPRARRVARGLAVAALAVCAALLPQGSWAEGPCTCADIVEAERVLEDVRGARARWQEKLAAAEAGDTGGDGDARADIEEARRRMAEEQGRQLEKCGGVDLTRGCTPVVEPRCKAEYCDEIWKSILEHEAQHCRNRADIGVADAIGRTIRMRSKEAALRWIAAWNEISAHEAQERHLERTLESLRRRFHRRWKGEITYSRKEDHESSLPETPVRGPYTRGGRESEALTGSKRYRAKVRVDGEQWEGPAEVTAEEKARHTVEWTGEVLCERGKGLGPRGTEWRAATTLRTDEMRRTASSPARATVTVTPDCDAVSVHVRVGRSAGQSDDRRTHRRSGGCGNEEPQDTPSTSRWETDEVEFGVQAEVKPGQDRVVGSTTSFGVTTTWDLTAQ